MKSFTPIMFRCIPHVFLSIFVPNCSLTFLFELHFYSEDGGDVFLLKRQLTFTGLHGDISQMIKLSLFLSSFVNIWTYMFMWPYFAKFSHSFLKLEFSTGWVRRNKGINKFTPPINEHKDHRDTPGLNEGSWKVYIRR
jgi:hypothetical protein